MRRGERFSWMTWHLPVSPARLATQKWCLAGKYSQINVARVLHRPRDVHLPPDHAEIKRSFAGVHSRRVVPRSTSFPGSVNDLIPISQRTINQSTQDVPQAPVRSLTAPTTAFMAGSAIWSPPSELNRSLSLYFPNLTGMVLSRLTTLLACQCLDTSPSPRPRASRPFRRDDRKAVPNHRLGHPHTRSCRPRPSIPLFLQRSTTGRAQLQSARLELGSGKHQEPKRRVSRLLRPLLDRFASVQHALPRSHVRTD